MNRAIYMLAAGMLSALLAAAQSGPARISGGLMAGRIVSKVAPVYPPEARAAHVSGTVVLHAIIGRDGTIQNLTAISGPEMLRPSALDAVSQWVYKPYLLNGDPTEVDTTITVNYNFGGEAPPPVVRTNDAAPSFTDAAVVQGQQGPMRVSGGVMAGMILTKTTPTYPSLPPDAHVAGAVVLHAIIGKDGRVEKLSVIAGPELLRAPILDAVQHWTYKPYLLNGKPVEVDTTITINNDFGGEASPSASARNPALPESATSGPGAPRSAPGSVSGMSSGAASPAPVRISSRVMAAQLIKQVPPVYAGGQGAVVLHAIIGKDGAVKNLQVVSGPPMFGSSAIDAARQWKYKPYLLNGEPVEVDSTITVMFTR